MPLIIAHRGASRLAPENTFAAFQRAVDAGADGIEFDVRLAKDGVAVVFHDPGLKRTAGLKGKVAEFTSDELGEIDVGSWFNQHSPKHADPRFRSEKVKTLDETLEFLAGFGGIVYIELKCRKQDIERLARAVCDAIADSPLFKRIVIKSFELAAISIIRSFCPRVRTAALFAPRVGNLLRKDKHLLRLAEDAGADEISLHYTLATRNLIRKATRAGMRVTIWTTDHPKWIRRGIELGLNAIITNDPAKLLAKRRELLNAA